MRPDIHCRLPMLVSWNRLIALALVPACPLVLHRKAVRKPNLPTRTHTAPALLGVLDRLVCWLTAVVDHAAVCPNSLAKDDPKCQNGGRLHANNSTMEGDEYYANCAFCDCPDGWAGFDCSGTS